MTVAALRRRGRLLPFMACQPEVLGGEGSQRGRGRGVRVCAVVDCQASRREVFVCCHCERRVDNRQQMPLSPFAIVERGTEVLL